MILGFLTTKISDIEHAANLGFRGVELNATAFCEPSQGALDGAKIAQANDLCKKPGVTITALVYYGLAGPQPEDKILPSYENVFTAAEQLGVQTITSMGGFDGNRDWAGNI